MLGAVDARHSKHGGGLPPGVTLVELQGRHAQTGAVVMVQAAQWGPHEAPQRFCGTVRAEVIEEVWALYESPFLAGATEGRLAEAAATPRLPKILVLGPLIAMGLDFLAWSTLRRLMTLPEAVSDVAAGLPAHMRDVVALCMREVRPLERELELGVRDGLYQLVRALELLRPLRTMWEERLAWWPTFQVCAREEPELLAWGEGIRAGLDKPVALEELEGAESVLGDVMRRGRAARLLVTSAMVHEARPAGREDVVSSPFDREVFRSLAYEARDFLSREHAHLGVPDRTLPLEVELQQALHLAKSALRELDPLMLGVVSTQWPSALEPPMQPRKARRHRRFR